MPRPAPVRVHAGVEDVRVARIGSDVGARRLRVDVQHLTPCFAAVDGLEDAALFVRPPLATQAAGVHEVGVLRVDDDARDLVRLRETDVRPVLAGIDGFVHAVADRRVVARILLAGADVYDVRIARRDRDGADRGDRLLVEDGLEGGAAVRGLDDAAVGTGDVVDVAVARHTYDHGDAAGVVGGTNRSPA